MVDFKTLQGKNLGWDCIYGIVDTRLIAGLQAALDPEVVYKVLLDISRGDARRTMRACTFGEFSDMSVGRGTTEDPYGLVSPPPVVVDEDEELVKWFMHTYAPDITREQAEQLVRDTAPFATPEVDGLI